MLPVFAINLDRRHDRWTAMMAQLDRLRIEAMRIPDTDAGSIVGPIHDGLSLPQSGCRESHLVAVGAFLRTDAPASLILEDDAELAPDVRRLPASVEWWPAGTNAIKVERLPQGSAARSANRRDAARQRNSPDLAGLGRRLRLYAQPRRR